MVGLRPGQTWESPVVDPSALILFGAPTGGEGIMARLLDRQPAKVQVQNEPTELEWNGAKEVCWLVVSVQDNLHIRIWVRQQDGLVLQQEAEWGATKIVVIRESTRRRDRTE